MVIKSGILSLKCRKFYKLKCYGNFQNLPYWEKYIYIITSTVWLLLWNVKSCIVLFWTWRIYILNNRWNKIKESNKILIQYQNPCYVLKGFWTNHYSVGIILRWSRLFHPSSVLTHNWFVNVLPAVLAMLTKTDIIQCQYNVGP